MELKTIEKKKEKTVFLAKGTNVAFLNSIRRIIVDDVPTMAIEEVEVRKNSSVLYDEMIAHRLGLIPLKTDLKSYNLPEKCTCQGAGCAKCTVKLILKAKGPGIVYASELKAKDPAIKPVFPETPIVKLLKNQELELEATAILGRGSEHVKWSPGLFWYKHKPVVEIKKADAAEGAQLAERYPSCFEFKNKKLSVNKDNIYDIDLFDAAAEEFPEIVKVTFTPDEFVCYLEPWGQLDAKTIMTEASNILQSKLDEFSEKIAK